MHRFIATAVCLLIALSSTGQSHNKRTVVLNDGSRIWGTIVGDSSDYIDVKVLAPQTIRIEKSHIASVDPLFYPIKPNLKTGGYYIRFCTSILSGKKDDNNRSSLSFHLSNGYQFKNGLSFGIGSGIEDLGATIVPLYADFRYTLSASVLSPYAWIKSGYGFATSDRTVTYEFYYSNNSKTEGGFLFNAGAGMSLFTWKRTAVNIGVGYRYQKISIGEDQFWWGGSSVRETVTHFNRLELQMGFTFR